MGSSVASGYREVAESAWQWVLDQVRWQDGPWVAEARTEPEATEPAWDRDGLFGGVGGLAQVLAEIRLARPLTSQEEELATAIAERVLAAIPGCSDCTYWDGLVSHIGTLSALGAPGVSQAVDRLVGLAEPNGWPQTFLEPERYLPGAHANDLTSGTAGVLLGAVWAIRHGVAGAEEVAARAAAVLLAEAEELPTGTNWLYVPRRFRVDGEGGTQMPNLSHGLAGIAAALAVAGSQLGRPDLVAAAVSGAEHLISLADTSDDGFVVPRCVPPNGKDEDEVTYTWCHGPTGTSTLFLALEHAEVAQVGGHPPSHWHRRCLHSVRVSGVPSRRYPGFWDNDGRCCGTAGVGDVFVSAWQSAGDPDDRAFAMLLADTLVERAITAGPHTYWRFIEHRAAEPLLPPGIGWMQGTAGIAAYLFRVSRVVEQGREAPATPRMATWWTLPQVRRR